MICPTAQAEYFLSMGWTGFFDLPVEQFWRVALNSLRHSGTRHLARARNPYSRSLLWIL